MNLREQNESPSPLLLNIKKSYLCSSTEDKCAHI